MLFTFISAIELIQLSFLMIRRMADFILDDLLTYKLHQLSKLIDQHIDFGGIDEFELSFAEGRVLAVIGYHQNLSVVRLAAKCNLDKSQASRAITALVEKNLVNKTKSAIDHRSYNVHLTDSGKSVYQTIITRIQERNELALSALDPNERRQLLSLLNKIARQLEF